MEKKAAFELALKYVRLGIPAFPINKDKEPATANGFKDATTNEQKLQELFRQGPIECGVGLLPGPTGYVVLDVDDKGGHTGSAEWIAWQEKYNYVRTVTIVTASGGKHLWFRKNDNRPISNTSPFEHIDIRADGGYVVAPGTYFDNEHRTLKWNFQEPYRFEDLVDATQLPTWVDERLAVNAVVDRSAVTPEDIDEVGPDMDELLIKLGGRRLKLRVDAEGNKAIEYSRPGKGDHVSASVGHGGKYNFVKFFSSSWRVPEGYARTGQLLTDIHEQRGNVDELLTWINETPEKEFSALAMRPEAFRGILGEAVALFAHTEADPVAILLALLTGFGNLVGRTAYVENVRYLRQYPALFTLVVGASGKARKSAAWSMARMVLKEVDEPWATDRMKGGFGSGQMVIKTLESAVAPIMRNKYGEAVKAKDATAAEIESGEIVLVNDERLFVNENEFGTVLKTVNNEGSVYSEVLRNGYDSEKLENRTKSGGDVKVPEGSYHLSLFANITGEELIQSMNKTELYNGFGNRFIYVWSKRSKVVAFSDSENDEEALTRIGRRLARKAAIARSRSRMYFDDDAKGVWTEKYAEQEADDPGGVLGTVIARSGNHTVRLALIYALLDGSDCIKVEHLTAALAVWDYCRATAVHLFKDRPQVQKSDSAKRDRLKVRITEYLYQNGEVGKTQLKKGSTSHSNESEFQASLDELREQGVVTGRWVKTTGADSEKFSLVKEK